MTTTTTSRSVPRSRLNITYRTQIEGKPVPKELPLRLLVAADFSGRDPELDPAVRPGARKPSKPVPMLDRRPIYSIGKEGTFDGALSLARVTLPIPANLKKVGDDDGSRRFDLRGHATIRVVKTKVEERITWLINVKSSVIEDAIELEKKSNNPSATSPRYLGGLKSVGEVSLMDPEPGSDSQSQESPAKKLAAATPGEGTPEENAAEESTSSSGDALVTAGSGGSKAVEAWNKWTSKIAVAATWEVTFENNLVGWLEPTRTSENKDLPDSEPPSMFEFVGSSPKLQFSFDEDQISQLQKMQNREVLELRVPVKGKGLMADRCIPVRSLDSFSPNNVASAVPSIRRLLVIRWLVSQARSMISSNPVLREKCRERLLDDPEGIEGLVKEISALGKEQFDAGLGGK